MKNILCKLKLEEYIFGNTEFWIRGLAFARQALYHLSHTFSLSFFILVIFQTGSLGTPSSHLLPPTQLGWQVHTHHTQCIGRDGVWLTFCLSWPQTLILPISASRVSGISGVSNHTQLEEYFLNVIKYLSSNTTQYYT
jgi:hypothetical protein